MDPIKQFVDSKKLILIAGPCVIENEEMTFKIAKEIKRISDKLSIPFIFKASYKKENRTKLDSFTGPGLIKGIKILQDIKKTLSIPITTDFHNADDIKKAGNLVDMIQIPAFLCRQTDILISAANTKKYINVKKAPFLSGESCKFIIEKIRESGNKNIILTERGNSFGYENLIVDMRNIPIMKNYNVPVIIDATHANQKPNQSVGKSGGTPEFIETLASSALAAGADGVFIETHPNPSSALSDGATSLPLNKLKTVLEKLIRIKAVID